MSDTKIKTSNIGNLAVTHSLLHTDMDLTSKTVQVAAPSSDTHPATKLYVDTEVANLIDSAPGTLDTLNELAAAINDDANFNATIASSIATKLPLSGGTLTGNLTLTSTASGSSASPEFELRRDITGADANYIGQIKFTADNDADQNTVFAKITGKILDASDGTEDGIIEFAHKKAGSNNISARFRSDSLQLINGTNLTVAGTTDLTGNLTVDTNTLYVDTSNNRVGIGTSSPVRDIQIGDNTGSAAVVSLQTTTSGNGSIYFGDNTATSAEYAGMLRYSHSDNAMQFWTSSEERMRIQSDGAVVLKPNGITTGLRLQGRSSDNNFYIQWKSNDGNTTYGSIGTDSTNTSLLYNTDIHAFNSASSANNFLKLQSTGAVFNEGGADRDFRVESNNNDNMLFVDAGNDRISVGSGSTYSMFNVISSNDNTSDWWTNNVATQYIQNTVGHPVLKMNNNNSNRSAYLVYNGNGSAQGFHIFDRQNEQSRISAYTSSVVINEAGTDVDFRVESDSNTHMLFVDASSNEVGIGTSDPRSPLHVQTSHSSTDVTAANTNSTLSIGNSATGNGVYNAIKFAANQQDMYIMSFNNTQVADRRLGFFLGSVAGDAVADERLSIRGNGNVGINDTTPSATLDIVNNDASQVTLNVAPPQSGDEHVVLINRGYGSHKGSGLRIAGANYTNGTNSNAAFLELSAAQYSGSGTRYIHAHDNSGTDFVVQGDGKVGIGTGSPDNTLTVNGGTESLGIQISETPRFTLGADGTWNYFKGKSGNGHYFNTTGGGLFVVNNAGNVGIGTSSPGYKLDVQGNFRSTGSIEASNYTGYFMWKGNGTSYDVNNRTTKIPYGTAVYSGYNAGSNRPTTYDIALQVSANNRAMEFAADWVSSTAGPLYFRTLRDCCINWSSWSSISMSTVSDRRVKDNIVDYTSDEARTLIEQLQAVEYDYVNHDGTKGNVDLEDPDADLIARPREIGYIAQDVEDVIPYAVDFNPQADTPNEHGWASAYTVNYERLVPVLTEALKDVYSKLDSLQTQLDNANQEIQRLRDG